MKEGDEVNAFEMETIFPSFSEARARRRLLGFQMTFRGLLALHTPHTHTHTRRHTHTHTHTHTGAYREI